MSKSKIIILIGFGAILLLVSLLIIVGITNLSQSKSNLNRIVNSNNLKIQLINKMHKSARERTINLQQMLIVEDEDKIDKFSKRLSFFGGQFVDSRTQFFNLNINEKEKKILEHQNKLSSEIGPIQNWIADLIGFDEIKEAKRLMIEQAEPLQNEVFKVLSELHDIQVKETKTAIKESNDSYSNIVSIMWGGTLIVILISLSIVYFTLKLISKNEKQQARYQEDIEYQAFYDHLTGLPNRRLLNDRMEHAIKYTERKELLMAVLFIDCDRFKIINDSLGHVVGDSLLVSIANRLKDEVRNTDTVCRVSGDEFAVVLEDLEDLTDVDHVTQKLLDSIAEPHYLEGHKVFTTVSVGITVYPFDNKDVTGLMASADIAMYHAKKSGGNQYEYFNSDMNKNSKQRLTLEQDLHEALDNHELEIYYQPLTTIDDERKIISVEALLRWHHPKQSLIAPSDFIGIAEDTGLIIPIGEWVLMTACKQVKAWEKQGLGKLGINVNLSPRQFVDSNLVSVVENVLNKTGIDPTQLDLEITESTAMYTIDKTIDILHKLKGLGVQISIDDFGTGYSSLSYLQKMPIDNLKIDRSFIKNIQYSENDKVFVQTIVTMAHTLGMITIAEGVEEEEQLSILKEMQCEIAQGYLFSQPLPAENIQNLLYHNDNVVVSKKIDFKINKLIET